MKTLHLAMIGAIAVGAIAFWVFYEPILLTSDKEKFSKPIVEQVVNHTQLAKLFGMNNMGSGDIVNLYDWSKDGKFIIAGFHISDKNYLISIDPNGTTLEKLDTPQIDYFYPARISPSGNYVLFSGVKSNASNVVSNNLYLFDMVAKTMKQLTNNTEYYSGSGGNTMILEYGWTPDGNIIYSEEDSSSISVPVGSSSYSLWKADLTGKKIDLLCRSIYYGGNIKSIPISCAFAGMSISPDGKEIAFSDDLHIGIYHMDTNQTTMIPNLSLYLPAITKWIPNNSAIVYDESTDEYTHGWKTSIISIDGSFNEVIYSTGWNEGLPVVSSDGKYIMFANSNNDIMRVRFG